MFVTQHDIYSNSVRRNWAPLLRGTILVMYGMCQATERPVIAIECNRVCSFVCCKLILLYRFFASIIYFMRLWRYTIEWVFCDISVLCTDWYYVLHPRSLIRILEQLYDCLSVIAKATNNIANYATPIRHERKYNHIYVQQGCVHNVCDIIYVYFLEWGKVSTKGYIEIIFH